MKNVKITAEQQKLIDLIKTQDPKNVRLAMVMDITQNLGVSDFYSNIYSKWEHLPKRILDLHLMFPIVSAIALSHRSDLRRFSLRDYSNKVDLFLEHLRLLKKYFINEFEDIELSFNFSSSQWDKDHYLKLHNLQQDIHKITGVSIKRITFHDI